MGNGNYLHCLHQPYRVLRVCVIRRILGVVDGGLELHFLADPQRWSDLLGYIRLGYGPHRAADAVGTTKRALDSLLKLDPFKAEQFEDAAAYWRETVEGRLHDAAADREPWAIAMVLKAEAPEKYGTKATAVTNVLVGNAEDLARLIELANTRSSPPAMPAAEED